MARFWKPDANRKWRSYAVKRAMGHWRGQSKRQRVALRKLLKQARLEAKLDQAQAAELLGQDATFICKIEAGRRQVEFVEVEQLAQIYRKPLTFFATADRFSKEAQPRTNSSA
jgi:DNA-binding XRE family transcriptional regulator